MLFAAEVIHVDHVAGSLTQKVRVLVPYRRTKGPRYVSPNQSSSYMGIGMRNPGRTWTGGSGGRAAVSTLAVCGWEKETMNFLNIWINTTKLFLQLKFALYFLLTVLASGRRNIPDARRQQALPPLVGGVTRAIAGASPVLPVILSSSPLSAPAAGTTSGTRSVHAHGPDPLMLRLVAVRPWQTTLLTLGEKRAHTQEITVRGTFRVTRRWRRVFLKYTQHKNWQKCMHFHSCSSYGTTTVIISYNLAKNRVEIRPQRQNNEILNCPSYTEVLLLDKRVISGLSDWIISQPSHVRVT